VKISLTGFIGIAIFLAFVTLLFVKYDRTYSFGSLWFVVYLMPVIYILEIGSPGAAYYFYIPLVGFAVTFVGLFSLLFQKMKRTIAIKRIAFTAIALLLSFTSKSYCSIFNNSQTLWENNIDIQKNNVKACIGLSKIAYDNGEFQKANNLCRKAVESGNSTLSLLFGYALSFNQLGQLDNAEYWFRKAIENSESADAYINIALILYKKGNFEEAITYMTKALQLKPNNIKILGNLISIYNKANKFDMAEQIYNMAISIDPKDASLYHKIANTYIHQDRYNDAVVVLEKSLKYQSNKADVYFVLGNIQRYNLKNINKSVEYYKIYLDMSPDTPGVEQIKTFVKNNSLT
jgi:tetratricopeptide (TPR) repeat protein